LNRLDLRGTDRPWGTKVYRMALCLAGVWAAYELVRPWRRNRGTRFTRADVALGWCGGHWPGDGA
jgi:hypothetical protein